jgi:hypothetical protein
VSNPPLHGQSNGPAVPAPTWPPPGEQRSGSSTSRSTRTQIVGQSLRCRAQRMIVVTQLCGPTTGYFRFGVCESADAAADFSALVLFGLASTLPAALAALVPVCRVLRFTADSPW